MKQNYRYATAVLAVAAMVFVFIGVAPAVGLASVQPGSPCPSTVYFYTLSTTGVVGTTPIGEVHLVSAATAASIWGVVPGDFMGLSATYNSLTAPEVPYVASTSPTQGTAPYLLANWGVYNVNFYSDAAGQYNSDGTCTNPGGFVIAPATLTTTTAATSRTVVSTSVTSVTSFLSTLFSGTTVRSTAGFSTTLVSSTMTSTVQGHAAPPRSYDGGFLLTGIGLFVVAGAVFFVGKREE
jgi:hypothetical protein